MGLAYVSRRVWRHTPGMRINQAHPLAQGLETALVPRAHSSVAIDLVSNAAWSRGTQSGQSVSTKYGPSVRKTSGFSHTHQRLRGTFPGELTNGACSGFILAFNFNLAASGTGVMCNDQDDGLYVTSAGLTNLYLSSAGRLSSWDARAVTTASEVALGFSVKSGDLKTYLDGVQHGTGAGGFHGFSHIQYIGGTISNFQGIFDWTLVFFWRRFLNADEHMMLFRDPFSLFETQQFYYFASSSPSTFKPAWARLSNQVISAGATHA